MGLVSEYNQAITPTGAPFGMLQTRQDTALLTPPKNNPLTPYTSSPSFGKGLGKRDAQLAELERREVGRSFKEMVKDRSREENTSYSHSISSYPTSARPFEGELSRILAQGHRLGIEYVDKRRFRVNSWQSYATLDTQNTAEAIARLEACHRRISQPLHSSDQYRQANEPPS